ncbi:hypothetical protein ACFOKI_06690 [Sphingomonas qilianensis]|uniref:Uncharacterized protein n=1 Tax=Sphingomonas qilianensis TaxID=1736690 RepID=A0ABU9XQH5_9SPHN
MTARLYSPTDWARARARRAIRGKAPRLAIRRSILMRQSKSGAWSVGIFEWRFGKWQKPQWLCGSVSFQDARETVSDAWQQYRLPVAWGYAADDRLRPLLFGFSEPIGGAA